MNNYIYFFFIALLQFTSAQVLSYVPRNSISQQVLANLPSSNGNAVPSNAVAVSRVPTAIPAGVNTAPVNPNAIAATTANIANANVANANIANSVANAVANQNAANANYAANYANQNLANAYAANAVAANVVEAALPVANANVALPGNLPTINGNMATFNLGTNGNTFTVTSGSPGAQGFGISVIADALEVGGSVAVNGQIPIFGTVALNGNVPTDGSAAVNYNCGGKPAPLNVAV